MNKREIYFKGRLGVASIAVLLALAATALKRDDSRRKAASGETATSTTEGRGSEMGAVPADGGKLLKGQGAYGDWREDAPGVRRLITPRGFAAALCDEICEQRRARGPAAE